MAISLKKLLICPPEHLLTCSFAHQLFISISISTNQHQHSRNQHKFFKVFPFWCTLKRFNNFGTFNLTKIQMLTRFCSIKVKVKFTGQQALQHITPFSLHSLAGLHVLASSWNEDYLYNFHFSFPFYFDVNTISLSVVFPFTVRPFFRSERSSYSNSV